MNLRCLPLFGCLILVSCNPEEKQQPQGAETKAPKLKPPAPGLELQRSTEEEAIFRRAFWRRPGPDDEILHAERREWVDDDTAVRHWQWFLAVRPGKKLEQWLLTENPFSVSEIESDSISPDDWITDAPAWIPGLEKIGGMKIQRSRTSRLTFLRPPGEDILYAFDAGRGFAGTP